MLKQNILTKGEIMKKKEERQNFVFFKNWVETINTLPEEYQLETYKSLCEYGLSGVMPSEVSAVVKAILQSFSVAMDNAISRHKVLIENAKKGGNPNFKKGRPNPYYSDKNKDKLLPEKDNQKITKDNPKIEDEIEVEDEVEVENEVENEDKDLTCLLNNKKSIPVTRASEDEKKIKNLLIEKYKQYFDFWSWDKVGSECYYEIMQVLADTILKTRAGKFKFRQVKYSEDEFLHLLDKLNDQDIRDIIWQVCNNSEIKNRRLYIIGAVINKAEQSESD